MTGRSGVRLGVAELETDLRILLARGIDGTLPLLGEARLRRARRAAAWIAANDAELRSRGLVSYGEKLEGLHLAPALEDALLEELGGAHD
jgi:hypothetical protein